MKKSLLTSLAIDGYCVVPDMYDFESEDYDDNGVCFNNSEGEALKEEILDWLKVAKVPYSTHGVVKHYQVGHQRFQWFSRTNEKVIEAFSKVYGTEDLVVSFDGIGYVPQGSKRRDNFWMHTDQAPNSLGFKSVQGVLSFTDNFTNTFKCIKGSHLLHQAYFSKNQVTKAKQSKNWYPLPSKENWSEFEGGYHETVVPLKKGDLLLFDSRLFHQNSQGGSEERLVQYLAYLPKSMRSENQRQKRLTYFNERRTTSHWAYPVSVNSLQPQTYGDLSKVIKYEDLPEIDLQDLNFEMILDLI